MKSRVVSFLVLDSYKKKMFSSFNFGLVGICTFFYFYFVSLSGYSCYACSYGKILVESVNQIYIVNVYCTRFRT